MVPWNDLRIYHGSLEGPWIADAIWLNVVSIWKPCKAPMGISDKIALLTVRQIEFHPHQWDGLRYRVLRSEKKCGSEVAIL